MAKMSSVELVEAPDGWVLPLAGRTVTQCRVDYAFTILLDEIDGAFEVRIEHPFTLFIDRDSNELTFDPEGNPTEIAPALGLLHQNVRSARARRDGCLELDFADGSSLKVPAGRDFEAWSVVGPGGFRVVSMPGGALAIWDAEQNR